MGLMYLNCACMWVLSRLYVHSIDCPSTLPAFDSWHFLAAMRTSPLPFGPQEPAAYGDPLQGALQDHRIASLMAPSGKPPACILDVGFN